MAKCSKAAAERPAEQGPILLLDTYSLFYRALFGVPPLTTSRGEPTSAIYGLSGLLLKLLRERRPAGVAFAIDPPGPTFRHQAYSEYKAHRPRAPGDSRSQHARLSELIEALGFPSFCSPGFEADDVLATLARELCAAGERPIVVSGDLDCLQIARPPAEVLTVVRGSTKAELYDEAAIRERFGVGPAELPFYRALVGDPSDNLPGVPCVGAKTAAELVRRFGSVEALLARLDEVASARIRGSLAEHGDALRLWFDLARLRADVPLAAGPRFAPLTEKARGRVRALFEELEFRSLVPRLDQLELIKPRRAARAA